MKNKMAYQWHLIASEYFWKLPVKNMKEPPAACYTEKM
ncbi:hypothetical protein BARD7_00772 [Bacillus amyloliquefaciens]|nr:hypothetical protein BARD7_00772 [Bacillus amyloliquefaciens]